MVFTQHKIYFNCTQPGSRVYNFGPAFNRYTILNNTSVFFFETSLPPAFAIIQVIIDLLETFISRFMVVFTLRDPLIYPLVVRKQLNGLFFHIIRKLNNFWLSNLPVINLTLGNVSAQFSTNGRRLNSNLLNNHFLFYSSLYMGLNLISLYQTEVRETFCQSNQKFALFGQMAKWPLNAFCLFFLKNYTYQLNSALFNINY